MKRSPSGRALRRPAGGASLARIGGPRGDALAVGELPPHHRDPFDRLLVAQALHYGWTLMTADPAIAAYEVDVVVLG